MIALILVLICPPSPLLVEQTPIDPGCIVPAGRWRLYTEELHLRITDDFAYADSKIEDLSKVIGDLRQGRSDWLERQLEVTRLLKGKLKDTKRSLDEANDLLRKVEDPPSRLSWFGAGAGAVLVLWLVVEVWRGSSE